MKEFLKKYWKNILFIVFIGILFIPATRKQIQIGVNQLLTFSPSLIAEEDQKSLATYNWKLESLEGEKVNFQQSQNKIIIVNFWATWCPPCIAEMPDLQKLYDDFGTEVDFYFLTNDDPKKVNRFFADKNYDLPVFYVEGNLPKPLNGDALPTTYIIDQEGKIIVEKVGAADWNGEKVRKILKDLQ